MNPVADLFLLEVLLNQQSFSIASRHLPSSEVHGVRQVVLRNQSHPTMVQTSRYRMQDLLAPRECRRLHFVSFWNSPS